MWFYRFVILLVSISFILYYTLMTLQLLDICKITSRKITWKVIIPFYYFFKRQLFNLKI